MTEHLPNFFGGNTCYIRCTCGHQTGDYLHARHAWHAYRQHIHIAALADCPPTPDTPSQGLFQAIPTTWKDNQ